MNTKRSTWILALGLLLPFTGCGDGPNTIEPDPNRTDPIPGAPVVVAVAVDTLPHDPTAFTQGLFYHDGLLYESTGLRGQSTLRQVDLETGEIVHQVLIPAPFFAEGITILDGRIYQLTWQENTGFVYASDSLEQIGAFSYEGEGWGLTTDGTFLIRSNGSNRLLFFDPTTFAVHRSLEVHDGDRQVHNLNELQWVRGEIWANIWLSDQIARIDAATGQVTEWLDFQALAPPVRQENIQAVLNGIAFDDRTGRVFITGKLWPVLYVLQLPDP